MNRKTYSDVRYMIEKECQRSSLEDLCEGWDVTVEDFYELLDAAECWFESKDDKRKKWRCDICNCKVEVAGSYIAELCCVGDSDDHCGCMGKPTNPVFCDACLENIWKLFVDRKK